MADEQKNLEGKPEESPVTGAPPMGQVTTKDSAALGQVAQQPQQRPPVYSGKQQTGQATGKASAGLNQVTGQPASLSPGEFAAKEFAQIVSLINVVSVEPQFQASQVQCPDKPRWCLPDVNCTARVTLSQEAIEAFKDNRSFCNPNVVN